LDALCATGIRVRRWRNEINQEHQGRLHITANDLDSEALDWALLSTTSDAFTQSFVDIDDEQLQPEFIERNGIKFQQCDARMAMIQGSFQWIDVDPFGSPISFIDGALQALGRVGVLEVTATDTAALTGSSSTSGMRRYGHKGIVDLYAHDDAVRVLLGTIATRAAQLDRAIEPILALFDGHHVRVSVRVRKSKQGADKNRELLGWRIRTEGKPYKFVVHPSPEEMEKASGPMWIGPLWNEEICSRLTEDHAVATCLARVPDIEHGAKHGLQWSEGDQVYAEREIRRSVRYIADAAPLLSSEHLLLPFDLLPRLADVGSLPTMERLIDALNETGNQTARVPDLRPFIATHAPFETVLETLRSFESTK
jgi:tRNA G26 N,N-dimethylase Trm1